MIKKLLLISFLLPLTATADTVRETCTETEVEINGEIYILSNCSYTTILVACNTGTLRKKSEEK